MGYTHYWKKPRPINATDWAAFTLRVKNILKTAIKDGYRIQYEYDQERAPLVSLDEVRFNGVGEDGHETFYMDPNAESFAFCKTARKPYDAVVVAILMVAEALLPGFEWSSDGDGEEGVFDAGKELVMRAYVEHAEDPAA